MSKGWISLHRSILENDIWMDDEPFDYRSAWIDLLLLANHEDKTVFSKGKMIKVKRGEVRKSISALAERWHWSRKKARAFIGTMEMAKMVSVESTTHGTTLTIENYSKYQNQGTTKEQPKEQPKEQQEDNQRPNQMPTNNKYNKDNNTYSNIHIERGGHFVPPTPMDVKAYCIEKGYKVDADRFCDFYESKGWMVGKNKMKDWKAAVRNWASRNREEGQDRWAKAYKEIMDE